jgi:hypothetical protein
VEHKTGSLYNLMLRPPGEDLAEIGIIHRHPELSQHRCIPDVSPLSTPGDATLPRLPPGGMDLIVFNDLILILKIEY